MKVVYRHKKTGFIVEDIEKHYINYCNSNLGCEPCDFETFKSYYEEIIINGK